MTTQTNPESSINPSFKRINFWWPEVRVVLVSAFLLLTVVGLAPLYTRGEAREALVAFDMFARQNFILPDGYGAEIPSKPPMLHWLICLVAVFSGMNEFALRAPSCICAALFSGFFFGILRRYRSERYAYIAVFMLFFSFEWLRAATSCRVDMVHSSCLATAFLCYFMLREGSGDKRWWYKVGCVAMTGAFLAKGPVAVLLGVLVIGSWELYRYRTLKTTINDFLLLTFWFAIVPTLFSLFWYIGAYLQGGDLFVAKFVEENLARFSGTMKKPAHEHGWTYLIGAGFLGTLPWSLFIIPMFWKVAFWKAQSNFKLPTTPSFRFSLMTALLVFIFYSLPSSKRSVYLLVSIPFWVIVALDSAEHVGDSLVGIAQILYRYLCIFVIALYPLIAIFYCVGKIADLPYASGILQRYPLYVSYLLDGVYSGSFSLFKIVLLHLPLAWAISSFFKVFETALVQLFKNRQEWDLVCLKGAGLFLTLYFAIQGVLLPVVVAQTSGEVFAKTIMQHVGNDVIVSFGQEFYSLSYYSQHKMKTKEKPFFFDEWVVLARKDIPRLDRELSDLQDFKVYGSEPPALKEGSEIVLGRIVRVNEMLPKKKDIAKKIDQIKRY